MMKLISWTKTLNQIFRKQNAIKQVDQYTEFSDKVQLIVAIEQVYAQVNIEEFYQIMIKFPHDIYFQ